MNAFLFEELQPDRVSKWFKGDYPECKQQFEKAVRKLNAFTWYRCSWPLPADPELSTDSLWIGNQNAQHVLVLISGTHGVEGYCGSAVQCFLLACLSQQALILPDNLAILMVHALNPWGMRWARRCDEQGIDLNRNFIQFPPDLSVDEDYLQLLDCMAIAASQTRIDALAKLAKTWGREKYERVFSGGQYQFPWAPFYGGEKPARANGVIDELIDYWQLHGRGMVVLDLHSGLGPWAFGELISDHASGSVGNQFAQQLFGAAVAVTDHGQSFSVKKEGLLDYRWHQLMEKTGCFLTLEFGSAGTDALFDVLVNDHLLWRTWGGENWSDSEYILHRKAMLEHFCPSDSLWQQAVLFKSWQVVERALKMVQLP